MAPPAAPRSVKQLSLGTTGRQDGRDGNLQGGLVAVSVAGAVGVVGTPSFSCLAPENYRAPIGGGSPPSTFF